MSGSNILALNCGSTSIKYKLFSQDLLELRSGQFEGVSDFDRGLKELLRQVIGHGEIGTVLHRVVHGGDDWFMPTVLDEAIIDSLAKKSYLAPLHNPYNIAGIKAAAGFLPEARQIALFDTAFYRDLPQEARQYALPKKIANDYGFSRFGFHGLSHEFVMERAAVELNKKSGRPNLITIHLGGGCSMTAIRQGKPIETSMGYTPNEGLIMMSRIGDIDSNLVLDLLEKLPGEIDRLKVETVRNLLNRESGIKALAGYTDFRELLRDASLGGGQAKEAFELFIHRIIKYIGAYHLLLEGKTEALVLTGSIGAGNPLTKEALALKVSSLKLPILTIRTDEELQMAKKARAAGLL
jgi:acetate kinase